MKNQKTKFKSNLTKLPAPIKRRSDELYKRLINQFKFIKDNLEFRREIKHYKSIKYSKNKLVKSGFMSESIKEKERELIINDTHQRVYYLSDVPEYLRIGSIFKLINLPLNLTLSYYIKGTSKSVMLKAARQRLSIIETLQNERYKKGRINDPNLEKEYREVDSFIKDLVEEKERTFYTSIYASITAENEKDLIDEHKLFQNETYDDEFIFNTYTFNQKEAFKSLLPFGHDSIKKEHLFQTSAVINLLPFLTRNINDPNGIFLGLNHYNNSILLYDFFKGRNANINIFGTSGSGKSYTSKLIITRLILRGVKCIIIDPEGEYTKLAINLKGNIIKFNKDNGINPFLLDEFIQDDNEKIEIIKNFLHFFITKKNTNLPRLDRKLSDFYRDEKAPSLDKFINYSLNEDYYEELLQLKEGSKSDLFSETLKINFDNDLIVVDLSELRSDERKIPIIYLIGTLLSRFIEKDTSVKKMFFIDEAHKLLRNKITKNFYIDLVKTARKRNTGIVSITQSIEDFKLDDESKSIITQAETNILLRQAYSSVKYLKDSSVFPITEDEEFILSNLEVGEALLIRDKEHIFMDVIAFEKEDQVISTNNFNN